MALPSSITTKKTQGNNMKRGQIVLQAVSKAKSLALFHSRRPDPHLLPQGEAITSPWQGEARVRFDRLMKLLIAITVLTVGILSVVPGIRATEASKVDTNSNSVDEPLTL